MEVLYSTLNASAAFFLGNLILTGIGGSVYVFCARRKTLLSKRDILCRYNIRGFSCGSGEQVLAYGGKEVGVFKVINRETEVEVIKLGLLESGDWVIYSRWVDFKLRVATLSAHNVVTIWNVEEKSKLWYSGFILGSNSDDLICFAGSVFGQVSIWSVHSKGLQNSHSKCPVLHYLKGHKGAVFSVKYDPVSLLICTTSDDRSVQWWNVAWSLVGKENESLHSLFELWSSANICRISIGFGHLARVWNCLSCGNYTFTVGEVVALEDGGVLLWNMSTLLCPSLISSLPPLEKDDPSRRVCLYGSGLHPVVITKNGALAIAAELEHATPNWQYILEDHRYTGLGLLETSYDRKSIAVTSSNGDVVVLAGNSKICGNEIKQVSKVNLSEEYALSVHWLSDDLLLTCGSEGKLQLWLLHLKEGREILREVGLWMLPRSKQRWTTAAAWIPWGAPPGLILCGNRSGDLLVYSSCHPDPVQILRNVHGQMGITSFLVLWSKSNVKDRGRHWMPTYHEMYIESQKPYMENIYKLAYNAVIYTSGRNGTLNLYVIRKGLLKNKGKERLGFDWAARCLILNERIFVFGFKGACAVIWGLQERSIVLEKNCGGGHRSWDLDFLTQSDEMVQLRLALIKNGELSLINWNISAGSLARNVLQEGLHSKEINCVRCHNMTSFKLNGKYQGNSILVISGSEDTTAKVSTFAPSSVGNSFMLSTINTLHGHLSSIRTIFVLPLPNPGETLCDTDMTGNPLQVFDRRKNEEIEENLCSVHFMIFTAGGRAQMKAWKLSFDLPEKEGLDMYMNCEQCRVEEQSSLLLGTKKHGMKEVPKDPESRFMDICAFFPTMSTLEPEKLLDWSTLLIIVVAACSDGILRLFGYRDHQNKSKLPGKNPMLGLWSQGIPHQGSSRYHCLLKVSHCWLRGRHLIITTDCVGYFHLWDVTCHVDSVRMGFIHNDSAEDAAHMELNRSDCLSPFFSKLVHQFSINAVDWMELNRNSKDPDLSMGLSSLLLVATGGEDGTLALNLLKLSRTSNTEPWDQAVVQISWCEEFVMATQVSGLKFVKNEYLVTVSKDQLVTLWAWKCDSDGSSISASVVSQYFSSIPDIQDIDIIQKSGDTYISICGGGLEVLHLSIPEEDK